MIRTYGQAVKFLESFVPSPKYKYLGRLALERMKYLVNIAGNPQFQYPTIHVGGTSGKGSTTTIIASVLGTKLKVGSTTSPHLVEITERIKINGVDISKQDLVNLVNQLVPLIEEMKKSKYERPSTFELIITAAFLYFLQRKVDVAVMEIGLGGRYDGTNVVKSDVSVITNIGLDHTQVLGNRIEKIALEKVGIIKEGSAVVSGVRQESVIEIVREKCKKERTELYLLGRDFDYKIKKTSIEGSVFDYFGEREFLNLSISLLGEHQVENAAIALRVVEVSGFEVTEENIREGLSRAFIPGRMEIVGRDPVVILDGAHNPDKMEALVVSMKTIFPKKKVKALVAIKKDKDAREMLKKLVPICQEIILSSFKLCGDIGEIGSYDPEYLRKIINDYDKSLSVSIIYTARNAYRNILKDAEKDDIILVTGSLYLVGEVRGMLLSKN